MSTLSLAAAGLRGHARRLIATGIAVALSVAFVTTAMLGLDAMERGARESVAGPVLSRDLVVWPGPEPLRADQVDEMRDLPGLTVVDAPAQIYGSIGDVGALATTPPRAGGLELTQGRMPEAAGEAVAASTSGHEVGDVVTFVGYDTDGEPLPQTDLTIVGLQELSDLPEFTWTDPLIVPESTLRAWDPQVSFAMITADLTGASPEQARAKIATIAPTADLLTGEEAGQLLLEQTVGDTGMLSAVLLGFTAVAVITAAMVIANTFAIVLAQRTRELALLRCVGATRAQVRRTVLLEALALGAVASTVGVLLGVVLVQVGALVVKSLDLGATMTLRPGWPVAALLVPWVVGLVVTVVAAWWPSRRATRVAPLAALQPASTPVVTSRPGRLRVGLAMALLLIGAAGLVLAAISHQVMIGVLAGLISFAGVLVAAVLVVPAGIRALGAALPGIPARLAVNSAVSNPSRAAATSAALLIGVTLITMTSVGAASATKTAEAEIDAHHPADVMVLPSLTTLEDAGAGTDSDEAGAGTEQGEAGAGTDDQSWLTGVQGVDSESAARVAGLDGVSVSAPLPAAWVRIGTGEEAWPTTTYGLDANLNGAALRSDRLVDALTPGTIGLHEDLMISLGVAPGEVVTVTGPDGQVQATVVESQMYDPVMPVADLSTLDGDAPQQAGLVIRLSEDADLGAVVNQIQEVVQPDGHWVTGGAPERASLAQVLSVLVLVTTGLLGVAVIIAVVGIANTLALSVLERARENSLLRALGLTRGQLRTMLTVEGILLALTSTLIGVGLGVVYAWFGVRTVLPEDTDTLLAFPGAELAAILGLAVLAGLLASVLPARRAARTAPAAGLATVL